MLIRKHISRGHLLLMQRLDWIFCLCRSVDRCDADLGGQAAFCYIHKIIALNLTGDKIVNCWKSIIMEVKQAPKSAAETMHRMLGIRRWMSQKSVS